MDDQRRKCFSTNATRSSDSLLCVVRKDFARCYGHSRKHGSRAPSFAPWFLQKPMRQLSIDTMFTITRNSIRAGRTMRCGRGQTWTRINHRMGRIIRSRMKYARLKARRAEWHARPVTRDKSQKRGTGSAGAIWRPYAFGAHMIENELLKAT
jgi:hypothetical protein